MPPLQADSLLSLFFYLHVDSMVLNGKLHLFGNNKDTCDPMVYVLEGLDSNPSWRKLTFPKIFQSLNHDALSPCALAIMFDREDPGRDG